MASRPTLAKVALTAGVSKTTASYVLNGQKKMSAETTRRVKEAARRLGYRLDSSASGLSRGRSQVIGVLAVESVTELVVGANSLFWLRFNDAFIRGCSDEGLVVSETAPGEPVRRQRFLSRNRIIAAVTRATLVVEAAERSGTTATARSAQVMNRPVMAVPGPVGQTVHRRSWLPA